jgi:hypothetical protein
LLNKLLGTLEGFVDVRTDIILAKKFVKTCFVKDGLHRWVHT